MKKHIKYSVAIFATFFITSNVFAGVVNVSWIGGASLPRNDSFQNESENSFQSESWEKATENFIYAIKNDLKTYDSSGQSIDIVSDMPDGTTVINLMNQKVTSGEITFEGRSFSGLGFFIKKINQIENIPSEGVYWTILVDGVESAEGASTKTINRGQTVRWTLGSLLNDSIVIEDNFGNYEKVLGTEELSSWNGKLTSSRLFPFEKGQGWSEAVWITTNSKTTFVPEEVTMTYYIEDWIPSLQTWTQGISNEIDPTNLNTITQSFLNGGDLTPGTNDDIAQEDNSLATESFIFGSNGITFFPIIYGEEDIQNSIRRRKNYLLSNKTRIRFVVEVPFTYSGGSSGTYTSEKITLKKQEEFESNERLGILTMIGNKPKLNSENINDLYEIQISPDLKNWELFEWKSGLGTTEQEAQGDKNFFRAFKY